MLAAADTIFALATGSGRAGVAIIRISGEEALTALAALSGRSAWVPRHATRVRLRDGEGHLLDEALALWFPAPASFTGEDVAELHVHGGRMVSGAVLGVLGSLTGLRPAEPGEFSRRAFRNGKMDLTQVEALADLVAAETAAQHRQALRQLQGELGHLYNGWRGRMITTMACLEADIDFADEDLPDGLIAVVRREIAALRHEIDSHLGDSRRGERIREGLSVVLVGAPNAGKSSLLNALAGREAAIVDAAPGTTRDVVEVPIDIAGLPVVLSDTAGLRTGQSSVEQEGVRRALQRAAAADLRVVVLDGGAWPTIDPVVAPMLTHDALIVVNKSDLGGVSGESRLAGQAAMPASALRGDGVAAVRAEVGRRLSATIGSETSPAPTRLRHRHALEACVAALARAEDLAPSELVADELRSAATALGRIVGGVDVEDVLDAVFREFCIGK